MYSRSSNEPYRIPDNYRGNAFHDGSSLPEPPVSLPETDAASPPPEREETKDTPKPETEDTQSCIAPKKSPPSLLSTLLPPKPKGLLGGKSGILGDIGTEELLILGIILLLSQNDSDDDILLLLLLLLFYK